MEAFSQKPFSLDLHLISDEKDKTPHTCKVYDLEPLLEYSPWPIFSSIVENLIKGCRKYLSEFRFSINTFEVLDEEKIFKQIVLQDLSKSIHSAEKKSEHKKQRRRMKALDEEQSESLKTLFMHKRKYSMVSKR